MPVDPQSKSNGPLPSPWKEFLSEIDSMLKEPLELHCIGGFVICYFYGLPRTTGDIDYYCAGKSQPGRHSWRRLYASQQIQNKAASRRRHDNA
jgi:hypothetical protein